MLPHFREVARAERRPSGDQRESLEEVRLPLAVVSHDEVEPRVELEPGAGEVPERVRSEGQNLHEAFYIRIGMTT